MRRVVLGRQGPPDVMRVVEAAEPEPAGGEVLVRVAVAGVNVVDLFQRSGAYRVALPFTPGMEGAGEVLRTGDGVEGVRPGDRVAWMGPSASYATHCVVAADHLVPVPDGVSDEDAAAVLVHGMTAHMLATDVVPLGGGDTCLVHAAGGGVGGLLCRLASLRGARVIGTASTPAKAKAARESGADEVVDYSGGHFADRVLELTGGRGVDVVYDAVGRDTFAEGLTCLRPRGTFVSYGQTGGPVGAVDLNALGGTLFLTKPSLGRYDPTPELTRRRAAAVLGMVGELRPRVHAAHPLAEAPAAHRAIESREAAGKVLIRPAG
ncbi:quinone oxidoreductase [Actinomadura sp. NEAU-AAG7]|uniref:quinone oxidoreductase family protein n=1 Tax=Actinomadura sp. NEAU-AAG7 TaxID=2839640 RepID=UPI001BE4AB5D|nr:quinone oxidoreductase [Actinomadura sp. NEAU-AAG7]MBT2212823.1 quinone oxidoreductase [Actinomadura sp. NEAU-AAG7]